MILILIGPPGSGKSTQSHLLVEAFRLPFISVGEIIRNALKTDAFESYRQKVDAGNLLPDQVVFDIIQNKLEALDLEKGFIMEGFPRTVGQAVWMDDWLTNKECAIDNVFYLDGMCPDVIKERILSRLQCSRCGKIYTALEVQVKGQCPKCEGLLYDRKDDHEGALLTRIEQYYQQSLPVIAYYEQRNVLRTINAKNSIEEVFQSIMDVVQSSKKCGVIS